MTKHSYSYMHLDSQVYSEAGILGSPYWGTWASSIFRKTYNHESGWYMDEFGVTHLETIKSEELVDSEYADHYFDHAGLESIAYSNWNYCEQQTNPSACSLQFRVLVVS